MSDCQKLIKSVQKINMLLTHRDIHTAQSLLVQLQKDIQEIMTPKTMPILHQKILTYIQKAQYIDENTLIQYILTLEPIDSLQAKDVIQTLLQKNLLEESNLYTYRSTEPTRIYLIKHIIV